MFNDVVYFAHGKDSEPWGAKITALAKIARKHKCHVESPDYSFTNDPEERVKTLLKLKPEAKRHLILVGSSMGGYVSTVASRELRVSGLFLMAPAFYIPRYLQQNPFPKAKHVAIVHGWNDEVIPCDHAVRFAQKYKTQLYLLDSDHRLTSALPIIEKLFGLFLDQVLKL